ncbi:hypothetical protein J6590_027112 [Homalodisca vitripennis]|nr:hypothetical protein J6590_027112 [Homalodisca vitripennis]
MMTIMKSWSVPLAQSYSTLEIAPNWRNPGLLLIPLQHRLRGGHAAPLPSGRRRPAHYPASPASRPAFVAQLQRSWLRTPGIASYSFFSLPTYSYKSAIIPPDHLFLHLNDPPPSQFIPMPNRLSPGPLIPTPLRTSPYPINPCLTHSFTLTFFPLDYLFLQLYYNPSRPLIPTPHRPHPCTSDRFPSWPVLLDQ